MKYHPSWPEKAIESFEVSISAHGGWDAWAKFESVRLRLLEFKGLLPFLKGHGSTFFSPQSFAVDPKHRTAEFDYGTHKDKFVDGKLIYSSGKIEVEDGRSVFSKKILEKWGPEHSLYFFGYAWVNYLSYPFILPQFELINWKAGSQITKFKIRFPNTFHTHSREQTFYFGADHMLFRHDYHADFAGSIFFGAHFTEGYESYKGIKIALIRKVRPRMGPVTALMYGIFARLELLG